MKSRYATPSLLLASLIVLGSPSAMASDDELAGLLLGAGAGAIVGHAVSGGDGAVVGGFLGAILGAAIADDDDRGYVARPVYRPVHAPPAVHYYRPAKVWVAPRHAPPAWHQDRDWRRDGPGHHDRGDWRDDRRHRDGERERERDHDGRSPRTGGPGDYRNR